MSPDHLTENEIDAILDAEPGSDMAAQQAHLASCAECRAELLRAQDAVDMLEHLPHRAPSIAFSSNVMSRVRVFEPVHVTLLETVKRITPSSTPARIAAAVLAVVSGLSLSLLGLLVASRADEVAFIASLTLDRWRVALTGALQEGAMAILGQPTAQALGLSGVQGVWAAIALIAASGLVAAFGLRYLILAARRGRS